ncbi:MAG TPA: hypothetical protein VGO43_14360 [Pyrinomonadaceae bacterium]|jgi:hypothetical protein|nr:hypothetical protein [Pyrinomonadaceae bacterium]
MKQKLLAITLVTVALSISVSAQRPPTFAAYQARVEKIRNINVDLKSHKNARMFRTNLRNAAKDGVNFAGHYILTGWGCGTNCTEWAIIDGRNGRVFFPREFEGAGQGFCELPDNGMPKDSPADDDSHPYGPLYFKPDSRLVVLAGLLGGDLNDSRSKCGDYYFGWTGSNLRRVKFIAGKRTDTP